MARLVPGRLLRQHLIDGHRAIQRPAKPHRSVSARASVNARRTSRGGRPPDADPPDHDHDSP